MPQLNIAPNRSAGISGWGADTETDDQIKVLVVEGDTETRSNIRVLFTAAGNFDLEFCSSDQEALNMAIEFVPDVAFLDASLPEEGARTILQVLHALPEMESVPIVLATNCHLQRDISQLYGLGAATVIARPYDLFSIPARVIKTWEQAYA